MQAVNFLQNPQPEAGAKRPLAKLPAMKLLLPIFLFFPLFLVAQDEEVPDIDEVEVPLPDWEFATSFSMILPQSTFRQDIERRAIAGGGFAVGHHLPRTSLVLTLGMDFYALGSASTEYDQIFDGELVPVRERTSGWLFTWRGGLRYLLPYWRNVQPYAEAFVQPQHYFLSTGLRDLEFDENISTENEDRDWSVGGGVAAGLLFYFPQAEMIQLNLKLSYLRTNPVDYYVVEGDGNPTATPRDLFVERRSQFRALVPEVGLVFPIW